jgi:hypothetical protein
VLLNREVMTGDRRNRTYVRMKSGEKMEILFR